MKNLLVAQSGGPTAVINASLAGVIQVAREKTKVLGAIHGIEGVINEQFYDLTDEFNDPYQMEALRHTPASFLGTCRHKLKEEEIERVFEVFKKHNIGYFIYIGGNDSMDTVDRLSKYAEKTKSDVKIIGVPKTIDNDLAMTDHTPGYGSAAKYIATSVREVVLDSSVYNKPTLTVIEVMGRNAGWLTAAAALARTEKEPAPHFIYLPEVPFDVERFIKNVKKILKYDKNIIVVLSEGVRTADGKLICELEGASKYTDAFGHTQLGGAAASIVNIVKSRDIDIKARPIELSLLQRSAAHIASKRDRDEAELVGRKGAEAVLAGKTGIMLCFKRVKQDYEIEVVEHKVADIANAERKVPLEWIKENGYDIKQELIDYMRPLIEGQVTALWENGLPVYAERPSEVEAAVEIA